MIEKVAEKKRGIYLHFPFCKKICNYCDFNINDNLNLIEKYIDSLCREIALYFQENEDKVGSEISSIYIGGGTPSLMSPDHLERIYVLLNKNLNIINDVEFSIESNPNSIDYEILYDFKSIGLNRISFGVQSFIKRELGMLSRGHSPKMAIKAIESAQKAGLENINLDLIFSIPGQTTESFSESIDTAISLGTKHISAYSLIYEPGTKLFAEWKKGKIIKQPDNKDADFYEQIIDRLSEHGMKQYEVSNFSFDGFRCEHNLHAWHCGEYFAFGVSSHGFLDKTRFSNISNIGEYFSKISNNNLPIYESNKIDKLASLEENIFLPLRADGINFREFKENTGIILTNLIPESISKFQSSGHIFASDKVLKLNKLGYLHCDTITKEMIIEANKNFKNV
jgi:putative oxygen-independent coproporphyrinogen III oxidase